MKNIIAERVDVWAASMKDEPGALAKVLGALRDVGADLNFITARRAPEVPGMGVVFLTPLKGDTVIEAATILGFNVTTSVHSVRIEGDNQPGMAAAVTEKLAAGGINLRGLSAAVIGPRFIIYVTLDTAVDAARALEILQAA
jgi:hypothetical protein